MIKFSLTLEIKPQCIVVFTVDGFSASSLFTQQVERARNVEPACHPKRENKKCVL